MSARKILAAVCAALALTLGSAGVALAYGPVSGESPSPNQDPCAAGPGVLRGTNGNDTLDARQLTGPVTICGFGGGDTIYANDAGDTIYAGPGSDKIIGGAGDDYIEGQGGDDYIDGGLGNDTILGQTGNDTIIANDGVQDNVDGGTGTNHCTTDPIDIVKNC